MLEVVLYVIGFLVVSFGFVVFFGAPYVPTLKSQMHDIVSIYPLSEKEVFVDIGSGDGVVLREVAKQGAKAIGYELNPWLFLVSKIVSRKDKNISIHFANFWNVKLPEDTTIIYTFLNGRYMPKLQQKLQHHVNDTGRQLYFMSYGFEMKGQKLVKKQGAMHLYRFAPLQS